MTETELRELIKYQLQNVINEDKALKLKIEVSIREPEFKRFVNNYLRLNKKYSILRMPEYSMKFGENKWKKETHWKYDTDEQILYVHDKSIVDILVKGGAPSDLFESNLNENKGQDLADKYVAILRKEFRKLNDDELEEFNKTIAYAFGYTVEAVTEAAIDGDRQMITRAIENMTSARLKVKDIHVEIGRAIDQANISSAMKQNLKYVMKVVKESIVTEAKGGWALYTDGKKIKSFRSKKEALRALQLIQLSDNSVELKAESKLAEAVVNEYMDINDPVLVAIRAWKTEIKKGKAAPKKKKISTKQYYKLMDKEIDLIDQMKDATKEFEQLDSDMNQEAGQKGDSWSDDDANRYGGELDILQTKIEKLAKQKAKVKDDIMNYRIN